jgi:serine/threonine protein kinase
MSGSPTEMPEGSPGHLPAHSATGPMDRDPGVRELFGHPTTIGRYHILEVIGEGGMGVVYRAEQRHPVRRTVALKLIKPGMDSRQIIARFESERQALALMDHPNVARVLDAGASDTGRPYFVMEHVPGESITQFCDRHAYTTRQRLELFIQACDAVQHAHQKAIIHRDLKPSNILVMLQDGKPRVKVIDFGVAKATAQKLTDRTLVTETGQMLGTREYMSPEQAEMSGLDVDTRSDVYSLGVVLYELLTGALPFDDLRSGGQKEMQRIIREVDPPRPSTRLSGLGASAETIARRRNTQLLELEKELKTELEWIPLKAMRKDRADRYVTPAQLAQDVENYLNHRPLLAAPESAGYRLRKFVRRNKGPVSAAATILVVLIAGIAGTTIGLFGQARQRAIAQREAQNAKSEAAKQRAVRDFLADMLSAADPQRMLGDKVTVLQAAQQALKRLDEGALKDQPLIEAAVRDTIATTLDSLSRYDEAEPVFRRSLQIRQALLPPDDLEVIDSLDRLGWHLRTAGKLAEAEPLLRDVLRMRRKLLPPTHPDLAESLNQVASLSRAQGNLAEAEALFREALAIDRVASAGNHERLAITLNNLAGPLQDLGKLPEAEALMRECLEIRRRTLPSGHPGLALTLHNLGGILKEQNRLSEAEPLLREALDIARSAYPQGHPNIAWTLNGLGQLLFNQGKLAEAEPVLAEALAIRRKALDDPHPSIAATMNNLAMVYRDQGRLPAAESMFRESLDMYRRALPNGHRDTALVATRLGTLYQDQGKLDEAEQLFRQALDIRRRVLPASHPALAQAVYNLAAVLEARGDLAGAEPLYRESLALRRQQLGPDAAPTTQAAQSLARVLERLVPASMPAGK